MTHKNYHWFVIIAACASMTVGAGRLSAADLATESAAQPTFVVIVHASNPQTKLTQAEISKLFLKKLKVWPQTNIPALPVDQLETAAVREQFSQKILEKKVPALKAYWQKEIFSGRSVPPPEKESDAEVLKYVADNAGAIGYVTPATELDPAKVAIVNITQ